MSPNRVPAQSANASSFCALPFPDPRRLVGVLAVLCALLLGSGAASGAVLSVALPGGLSGAESCDGAEPQFEVTSKHLNRERTKRTIGTAPDRQSVESPPPFAAAPARIPLAPAPSCKLVLRYRSLRI